MSSKGLRQKPFRRFALTIVGTVVFIVLLFTSLNTWINPLWVTPTPWTDESFAEYRPIYRYQRTAKAGLVRSEDWNAAFFGSSRIDIAFDPALPQWGDERAVNLSVSAGTLPETAGILHYTLEHSDIDIALIGIDISDLLTSRTSILTAGYMESPFNEKGDAFERELRYLSGISTFESSIKALTNKSKGELPEYTPQGHRLRHQDAADIALVMRRDSVPHALRTVRGRKQSIEPDPGKVANLQQILDETKAAGCKLVLVIPPSHAVYIGVFHYDNDPDPAFSKDRGLMAEMVAASNAAHPDAPAAEIWDFNDFHPLNCEEIPDDGSMMEWWVDGTHARRELGTIMLSRIMGWPIEGEGADYGYQLNSENLDQRVEDIKEGYQRFKQENPKLWQWMADSAAKYRSTEDSDGE